MTKIYIDIENKENFPKINKNVYGCFIEHLGYCVYGGIWVEEDSSIPNTRGIRNDVVEALRNINIPVLRWPGGCFADTYHWEDGIGPKEKRPSTVNIYWGGVIENNHFGTHEFLDLCGQLGCEPYICGNVGSGTVKEMAQWIEYLTCDVKSAMAELRRINGRNEPWKIKFWGVGNENWGCGGFMNAETYAELYFKFSTYCRNFGNNELYKIAGGPSGYSMEETVNWFEALLKRAIRYNPLSALLGTPLLHGISLHYYIRDVSQPAYKFKERSWFRTMKKALDFDTIINKVIETMDKYDPNKNIGLIIDEWGTWWDNEPGTDTRFLHMQNTMRDALVAALILDIFNIHCDRIYMANVSETINAIDSLILTKNEKMILTPTYHVFEMYKVHQDAILLPLKIKSEDYIRGEENLPAINGSASMDNQNKIHITLSNIDPENSNSVTIDFSGIVLKNREISARILRGENMNAYNTFDSPENVKPTKFNSQEFKIDEKQISFNMPSMAIIAIELS